jgi:hypothetical protein
VVVRKELVVARLEGVPQATDLRRRDTSRPPLLALLPRQADWTEQLEKLRELWFGVRPLIG